MRVTAFSTEMQPHTHTHTHTYTHNPCCAGFGMSLVAESTSGALLSAEATAEKGEAPEDLGKCVTRERERERERERQRELARISPCTGTRCARLLCEEVHRGGCVDTQAQHIALLLMVLSPEVRALSLSLSLTHTHTHTHTTHTHIRRM